MSLNALMVPQKELNFSHGGNSGHKDMFHAEAQSFGQAAKLYLMFLNALMVVQKQLNFFSRRHSGHRDEFISKLQSFRQAATIFGGPNF